MKFSHFILTRFNVKNMFGTTTDKYDNEVLTIDWLKHRFELFENYCLPSIINQKNNNFQWLIYFDLDTNKFYLNKIKLLQSKYSFIKTVFVQDVSHMFSTLKQDIDKLIISPTEYLITTTLDNDDCLHEGAIGSIQDQFRGQKFEFINFHHGYSYDLVRRVLIEKTQLSNGNGTSLIEQYQADKIKTVWCDQHGHLSKHGKIINLTNDRSWLQILHDKNVSNDLLINRKKLYLPVIKRNIEKSFGIRNLPRSIINFLIFRVYYYYYVINIILRK